MSKGRWLAPMTDTEEGAIEERALRALWEVWHNQCRLHGIRHCFDVINNTEHDCNFDVCLFVAAARQRMGEGGEHERL